MASGSPNITEKTSPTSPKSILSNIVSGLRPYASSKEPALGLSVLFACATVIPRTALRPSAANIPPFLHCAGFSAVFGGTSYVLSTGDIRNGSGITTAWSLVYLFFHLRKSLTRPRSPLGLALSGAAAGCASLYGTEYFWFQD